MVGLRGSKGKHQLNITCLTMSEDKDIKDETKGANEDSIRVICRFRPLNDTEEKTGSKFIMKFPSGSDDQCVSLGVSFTLACIR